MAKFPVSHLENILLDPMYFSADWHDTLPFVVFSGQSPDSPNKGASKNELGILSDILSTKTHN